MLHAGDVRKKLIAARDSTGTRGWGTLAAETRYQATVAKT
jgi:hypothetical protein